MLLLVRLFGSKAIIHNSPFQNPVVLLCTTKATENMEYNLMDYHFFLVPYDTMTQLPGSLFSRREKEDWVTEKLGG